MRGNRWVGLVQMAEVMLCRVARAALVQKVQHLLFQMKPVFAGAQDVVLVEDMAEEMAVIELDQNGRVELGRQMGSVAQIG